MSFQLGEENESPSSSCSWTLRQPRFSCHHEQYTQGIQIYTADDDSYIYVDETSVLRIPVFFFLLKPYLFHTDCHNLASHSTKDN